jgi:tripartite ATP-independent transporter DctM subunit
MFINKTYGGMDNFVLVAVPLFILMAQIIESTGVAEKLYQTLHVLMGPIRGGLALATIMVCVIFAASCGIVGATEVAVGVLAVPALLKRNYSIELTAGTICAGGTLGIIIPPSVMLVVYGSMKGMSVGKLFAAAFFPGLLLAVLYMAYILIRCGINPNFGPPLPREERIYNLGQKLRMAIISVVPPLVLIFVVLGSIVLGIATPTEASGMGCLGAFLLALLYRRLNWKVIRDATYATLRMTSMILTLYIGGNCFSSVFLGLGGGSIISDFLLGLNVSPYVILWLMMLCVFFLGMFIDWIAILLILLPIFVPIATELGFDELWFATLICVNFQMSFLTPPFGYSLFFLKGIAPEGMTMNHIYRGVVPFIILQWIGLAICVYWPNLVLYLPNLIFSGK